MTDMYVCVSKPLFGGSYTCPVSYLYRLFMSQTEARLGCIVPPDPHFYSC